MRNPEKFAFSAKYSEYGIGGAYGLSDHGFCRESSIAQSYAVSGKGVSKMKEKDLEARWDVRIVGGSHRYPIDTHHSRNRRQGVRTSGLEL